MRPGAAHQHSCYAFASLCEPALGKPHQVGRDVSIYSYERSNLLDWQAEIAENAHFPSIFRIKATYDPLPLSAIIQ